MNIWNQIFTDIQAHFESCRVSSPKGSLKAAQVLRIEPITSLKLDIADPGWNWSDIVLRRGKS